MTLLSTITKYILTPYILLTTSLYALSLFVPAASFFARALAYIAGIIICASYGVVASIFLNLVGKAGLSQWTVAKAFKWLMYPFTGVWFDIEDEHGSLGTRPCVVLLNHQTELDILLLGHIWPKYTSVTSKDSLKYYPFLGQFMYFSNTVFINRTNSKTAIATFSAAASTIRSQRQNVLLFPEGTRSYFSKPDLLPFKKGGFHLAVQAQVPIVPVVCANYNHVLDMKRLKFVPGNIPVKVLKAVETKGLTSEDVPALVERVRQDMLVAIKELEGKVKTQVNGSVSEGLRERSRIALQS